MPPPPGNAADMTALSDSLTRLGDLNEAMLKSLEKIEKQNKTKGKQDEKKERRAARVSKSIYAISDTVPLIGKLMRTLGGTFKTSFKESFEIQKRGLARGVQLTGLNQMMSPTVEGLSHLTDDLTSTQIGLASFEAGLRETNPALDRLALQTKLTGGNEKKLLKDLGKNTAGMGMSNDAMFHLAERTQGLAQTFGLTTEEMVGAMSGLGKDLHDLAALGLGADYMEAVATLTAGLGPEMADLAPEVLKALSSGSNMIQNSMLGGAEKISALTGGRGDTSRIAIEAMLEMGAEAKRISKNYTEGAHHQRFAMDLFKKVHGEQAVLYMRAAEQFKAEATARQMTNAEYTQHLLAEQKIADNYAETWDNFKRHVMEPFFSSMIYVVAALSDFVKENKAWVAPLIKVLGAVGGILGFALILKQGFRMFKAGVAALTFGKFLSGGGAAGAARDAATGQFTQKQGFLGGLGNGLKGLASGLRSMGSATAKRGAVTIMILAAALIPLAAAMWIFSQIKDVEGMFIAMAAGIVALASVALIMAFLAPLISVGLPLIYALAGVVFILAAAMALAAWAMTPFVEAVSKLTFENATALAIMAVSLGALAVALGYFGIVGWLGVAALWAFGSKVQDLAEHAPKLTKMANSLQLLPKAMSSFKDSVGQLTGGPLETLTSQLAGVREEIELLADQNSALVALGTFSKALTDQAATKATADSRSAATSNALNKILLRQEKILEQIEENTEVTAGNTQRKIGSLPTIDKKP